MTTDRARSLLGLREAAERDEIVRAHRRLAFEVHPDRRPAAERTEAEARLVEINVARDVLLRTPPPVVAPKPPRRRVVVREKEEGWAGVVWPFLVVALLVGLGIWAGAKLGLWTGLGGTSSREYGRSPF